MRFPPSLSRLWAEPFRQWPHGTFPLEVFDQRPDFPDVQDLVSHW
ncbi:hypothetical protein JOF41_003962 [Saccharothrix coeruleofusca]|nr:hypothetical protein [Saccharothrix coeruleofusca]MBP2337784.1 hypothetical protein [Saccharothrix coeruleofusca]